MKKIIVGILLLYLELYDNAIPGLRSEFGVLTKGIRDNLEDNGFEVEVSPICRVEAEFKSAINGFENRKIDIILTLHLAYSPSMEVIGPLSKSKLPVVVFDTTLKYDFSNDMTLDDIMSNHGIHGAQDMCNLLIRNRKRFLIVAGHWKEPDTIKRLVKKIKAASVKSNLNRTRAGNIGGWFKGMGDFFIEESLFLKDFGISVIFADFKEITGRLPNRDANSVNREIAEDRNKFIIKNIDENAYINTIRTSLALRGWIKEEKLDAFSMNFANISGDSGFLTIPFLEASKSMSRGIGYAGEGDLLTASLVSALLKVYPRTSFAEMFCPDWKNNLIFLSHMGEMNISLTQSKPRLVLKKLPFIDLDDPVVAIGQFVEGDAVIVDLAPSGDGYILILSQVKLVNIKHDLEDTVSGWIKPQVPINIFLEKYSESGGSHHLAIVYGDHLQELIDFGKIMGFGLKVID